MRVSYSAFCAILLISLTTFAAAEPQGEATSVTWHQLESFVLERRISFALASGVELEGIVLAVQPETLVADIENSSDRETYPEGRTTIPRGSISAVRVREETRGWAKPVLATAAGVGVGLLFIPNAFLEDRPDRVSRSIAESAGITAGAAVGGYFIGRALSDTERVIRVVEPPVSGTFVYDHSNEGDSRP